VKKAVRPILATAAMLGLAATGCFVEESAPVGYGPSPNGDIAFSWSIDGDATGAQCAAHGASYVEIKVTDPNGNVVDDWQVSCLAGLQDEILPQGAYTATAVLEDVNYAPVTAADPASFQIVAGATTAPIDFDFEENSFTNGT